MGVQECCVIPANAGVILYYMELKTGDISYPRECGGDPNQLRNKNPSVIVIPANAGVILRIQSKSKLQYSYPRECGGDPMERRMLLQHP